MSDYISKKIIDWISIGHTLPLQIDLTNACNLSCSHCYHSHHKNVGALGAVEWCQIIDDYVGLIDEIGYAPELIIGGGEPFASTNFELVLSYASSLRKDWRLIILTNGTLVERANLELLKKFSTIRFQVSLDGPDATRHDSIRGRGSFEKAMRGISILRQNKIEVHTLTVLSKRTSKWIGEFFALGRTLNLKSVEFARLVEVGQAKESKINQIDQALDSKELRQAYKDILNSSYKYRVPTETRKPLFALIDPRLGASGRFWESIVVDYQGYVLMSSRSRLRLGHALKDGIRDTFLNHPTLKNLRNNKIEGCDNCIFLKRCGGDRNAAFAYNGDPLGKDPGCWML
ncbi:MAG: radical SAM protein [Pseudobdellovibrionaceae bacterium]|nr:radical SAM protein [Bdellovibrionales bacterium]USN46699.1 MAG: radical SAM protein [Pseudobdellovibrionaceae bacterium]